jgi:hypothetical protein
VSLEEVFLQVTTEEKPPEDKLAESGPGVGPALSEDGARAEGEGDGRVEGEAPHA